MDWELETRTRFPSGSVEDGALVTLDCYFWNRRVITWGHSRGQGHERGGRRASSLAWPGLSCEQRGLNIGIGARFFRLLSNREKSLGSLLLRHVSNCVSPVIRGSCCCLAVLTSTGSSRIGLSFVSRTIRGYSYMLIIVLALSGFFCVLNNVWSVVFPNTCWFAQERCFLLVEFWTFQRRRAFCGASIFFGCS